MKTAAKVWRVTWRIVLCLMLLAWVFHTIFMQEGKQAFASQGGDWNQLARMQQWQTGWSIGSRELWKTITLIEPLPGVISLVFMGATIVLGMLRWRMVVETQGIHLSAGRAAVISLVAHFFNSLLLGSTGGDIAKAYYASRETEQHKTEAVVAVFMDRLIGLLSMLVFAALMMVPNLGLLTAHRRLAAVACLILIMLLVGGGIASLSLKGGLSRFLPNARDWFRRLPKGESLERALNASRTLGKRRSMLIRVFGISMVLNVACVFQYWALAWGLHLKIEPVSLFLIVPCVICISALPITPSGLGVRENLYVWMLAVPEINIAAKEALSLSLLAYAGSLFWSVVGGLVYMGFRQASPPGSDPLRN